MDEAERLAAARADCVPEDEVQRRVAEARAEAYEDGFAAGRNDGSINYKLGRADALREAAERVRAVVALGGHQERYKRAVLAILDRQP